jgi:hypothetical protein
VEIHVKLPLAKQKHHSTAVAHWTAALPFVKNELGVLIHRPKTVAVYNLHRSMHLGIHYWCGNAAAGADKFTFLQEVPEGMLICARCEAIAVLNGLPSTLEICGKHIHEGKVVAVQTCCGGSNEG